MRSTSILFLIAPFVVACTGKDTDTSDDTGGDTGDTSGDTADTGGDTSDTGGSDAVPCVEEGGACVLSGAILESGTLTADKAWLLRSGVFVGDDSAAVTLTIEPGTTVYGESSTSGFLVVTRGSRIVAEGTANEPIVFTADLEPGSRSRGSWGGLVLNGRAPINACLDGSADCEAEGEGGTGKYGGSDPDDDSGSLRYVRIEFGGTEISKDNEINGLTLAGVGRGTELDYVQVHYNLDDGIEFFGGTVDLRHAVITGSGDDNIDWDLGWQGRVQYAVVQQASDAGNNGIEADNNEDAHDADPTSSPVFSNVTLIGSPDIEEDNFGLVLRRGTSGELHNVAVAGFTAGCLAVRDQVTFDHFSAGEAAFAHARFACENPFEVDADEDETMTEEEVFAAGPDNLVIDDLELMDAWNATAPDFRPMGSSALLVGGQAPADTFFTATTFVGAFDATTDWTDGWTSFSRN